MVGFVDFLSQQILANAWGLLKVKQDHSILIIQQASQHDQGYQSGALKLK